MVRQTVLGNSIQVTKGRRSKEKDLRGEAKFLDGASEAVHSQLASTIELATFRQTPRTLSRQDRLRLVEQALVLFEENYVNLPLKRAMHAVNPVQQLRLLQSALRSLPDEQVPPEHDFHRTMIEIFMSVRDLHTNYILPAPYNRLTAFLPFLIEPFYEGGRRRYLVSHVTDGFDKPPFAKGVEVLSWNGISIERAVEINGNRYAGSNLEARHARGVNTMTVRPLILSLPPDEDWVVIAYQTADRQPHELRIKWLVFSPAGEPSPVPVKPDDATLGSDVESEAVSDAKRILFAPQVVEAAHRLAIGAETLAVSEGGNLPTSLPKIFEARSVTTTSGTFAYVRVRSFAVAPQQFIPEFIRLVQQLPEDGLIVDVRSNGGGQISSGELLLQLLTPRMIEPEPVQFINSSVNLRLCERHAPSQIPG